MPFPDLWQPVHLIVVRGCKLAGLDCVDCAMSAGEATPSAPAKAIPAAKLPSFRVSFMIASPMRSYRDASRFFGVARGPATRPANYNSYAPPYRKVKGISG